MIRAVLDCNVVITAALSAGKCSQLLSRARQRDGFDLVWSPPIVAECLRVIEYPKFTGKFRTDPRVLVERAMASAHMVATDLLDFIPQVFNDPMSHLKVQKPIGPAY